MVVRQIAHGQFVVHKIGTFTIRGCRCNRGSGAEGWFLISDDHGSDRQDYWSAEGEFTKVLTTSSAGGETILEFETSKCEPDPNRKRALLATVALFEKMPEIRIVAEERQ